MVNLPSWAGSIVAVAVGLAPGLLVLSTGFIARFLHRLTPSRAKMRQPDASRPREQPDHDLTSADLLVFVALADAFRCRSLKKERAVAEGSPQSLPESKRSIMFLNLSARAKKRTQKPTRQSRPRGTG
jgi:hypothetical protein